MALHNPSHNDWYRIKNRQDGGPTQIHIYDEIGYFGVSSADFVRDLADVDGPIEVHLNSPGGEVWDGIAIYNALLARRDVSVHIDGIAASIASVIAMAGNPVLIARNGQMMIHDGFCMALGNAQDLRETAEQLDKASNNIASIYADHTGRPTAYWREIMKGEAWYDADEAIDVGLADRVIESGAGRRQPAQPKDKWDLSVFGPHGRQTSPQSRFKTGLPPWDPNGVGDDDSTPEGDTDHSHWSATGRQIAPVPGRPLDAAGKLIDITAASVDNSPWDAGRAMHAASQSDNPEAFFRAICAGEKTDGDPDTQAHWALPYRYSPSAAPNKAGVTAALGRLGQTQDLKNADAAKAKLQRLMKEIDPDYSPSDVLPTPDNPFGLGPDDFARLASELKGALR
jgi:ATP-dependent protease ClpP protease subunit